NPDSRIAAAAGGCVLVRRSVLVAIGGFAALRDAVIDDCTLARLVKGKGFRIWIGVSRSVVMLRDHSFRAIWNMVARTAFTQLHYSYFALVATLAGLGLVFEAPLLLLLSGPGIVRLVASGAWILMALSYVPTARYYDESPFWGFLLPVAAFLFFWMSVHSA
ncbi:Glycosyl transferase, family 2, partial [mine drainage metagenome]